MSPSFSSTKDVPQLLPTDGCLLASSRGMTPSFFSLRYVPGFSSMKGDSQLLPLRDVSQPVPLMLFLASPPQGLSPSFSNPEGCLPASP